MRNINRDQFLSQYRGKIQAQALKMPRRRAKAIEICCKRDGGWCTLTGIINSEAAYFTAFMELIESEHRPLITLE